MGFAWHNLIITIIAIIALILVLLDKTEKTSHETCGTSEKYSNERGLKLTDGRYSDIHNKEGNYLFDVIPESIITENKKYPRGYMLSILQKDIAIAIDIDINELDVYYSRMTKFITDKKIDGVYLHAINNNNYMSPQFFLEKIIMKLPKGIMISLIYDDKYSGINFTTKDYGDYSKIYGGISWDKAKNEIYGSSALTNICPTGIAMISNKSELCQQQEREIFPSHKKSHCRYYPPGCPNSIEQFCAFINVVNALILKEKNDYSTITQIYNMSKDISINQILIATQLFPYVSADIKNHIFNDTEKEALKKCGGNKSLFDMLKNSCCDSAQSCEEISRLANLRAKNTIYSAYQNNPEGLLAFVKSKNLLKNNPIFEVGVRNNGGEFCNAILCETADNFGTWTWDNFERFMNGYYAELKKDIILQEFIISEWNYVPFTWSSSLLFQEARISLI